MHSDEKEIEDFQTVATILLDAGYVVYRMGGFMGPCTTVHLFSNKKHFDTSRPVVETMILEINIWWKRKD